MTDIPKERSTGRINVNSYDAKPHDDTGDFTISEANVIEEFAGGLVGVGSVHLILVNELDGTAHFTGMERFLGKLGERSGSFIFQNSGTLKDGELQSEFGYVESHPPRDRAFQRELEAELDRMRVFLA